MNLRFTGFLTFISSRVRYPDVNSVRKQFSRIPAFDQTGEEGSVPLLTFTGGNYVTAIAFSSDGTHIVSGSVCGYGMPTIISARVWNK
jgi:hypothetical protein